MKVASMMVGMYAITFTLFALETGSITKAASMGLIAASLKSAFSLWHGAIWRKLETKRVIEEI